MALFSRKFVSGGDPIVDPGFSKDVCASLMLFLLPFAKILQKERKTKLQARKTFGCFAFFKIGREKFSAGAFFLLFSFRGNLFLRLTSLTSTLLSLTSSSLTSSSLTSAAATNVAAASTSARLLHFRCKPFLWITSNSDFLFSFSRSS